MKTRIFLTILMCVTALGFAQTVGDTFTENGIEYEVVVVGNSNRVITRSYTGFTTVLTIPATVTDTATGFNYDVTGIGSSSFFNNSFTNVTIPSSVISIGLGAFSVSTVISVNTITTFTLNNPIPVIYPDILFGGSYLTNADVDLTVPTGTEQDYINAGWTGFKSINGTSTTFTENDILYTVTDISTSEISPIDYTGTNTTVTIPATVNDSGVTYTVTSIGNRAFSSNALTSVTIPSSVIEIGASAFSNNALTNITIPASVTTIGNNAFNNSTLTAVTSNSTTPALINKFVFGNNINNLIDLTIPTGLEQTYLDANWIGFKTINSSNIYSFTENDIVYGVTDTTSNELIILSYIGADTAVVIPATVNNLGVTYNVTKIDEWVFFNKSLTSVIIPNTITSIGDGAFQTNLLTSVTIPASVATIGDGVFYDNSNLTEVISESTNPATLINNFVFGSNSLIDLTIPTGLEQTYLDANWVGFKTINSNVYNFTVGDILYTIVDITNNAVSTIDYTGTNTVVNIPATVNNSGITYNVIEIGGAAFIANSLTSVTIPSSVISIGVLAFSSNSLTSVTIPSSVTAIGSSAFSNNSLTSVTIPSSVTEIGANAFFDNRTLRTVISESTTPAILPVTTFSYSFDEGINSLIDLTIPTGTTTAYTNAGWTGFNSVTEDSTLSIVHTAFNNAISVYPNPIQNTLNLSLATGQDLKNVEVFTLSGKKVLEATTTTIDFSAIATGVYVLKVENTEGKVAVRKIIKE